MSKLDDLIKKFREEIPHFIATDVVNIETGLSVAGEMGIEVPRQLSIVAWNDSVLCRLTHPAITALAHDAMAYGAHAARRLLEVIEGAEPQAHQDSAHTLVPRGTTSPPRRQ